MCVWGGVRGVAYDVSRAPALANQVSSRLLLKVALKHGAEMTPDGRRVRTCKKQTNQKPTPYQQGALLCIRSSTKETKQDVTVDLFKHQILIMY